MNQKIIPVAAAVVLVLASVSIARTQPRHVSNEPPMPPPRSDFARRVAAVGLVEPRSESIAIASHLPGVVERVLVQPGQQVRCGEELVRLDTRALEAARDERRSELASRVVAVDAARAQLARARSARAEAAQNRRFGEALNEAKALSVEEITRRRTASEMADADEQAAEAGCRAALAAVETARAALHSVEVDLERSRVTSPIDGTVLQVRIRPGESVTAGPQASPWMVVGDLSALHVRVDIDEHEAWKARSDAAALGQVRGNPQLRHPLVFVRFEPLVIPKQSLSGASTERVDTRVLQAIYRIDDPAPSVRVGQQMDVFIEGAEPGTAMSSR